MTPQHGAGTLLQWRQSRCALAAGAKAAAGGRRAQPREPLRPHVPATIKHSLKTQSIAVLGCCLNPAQLV